MVNVLLLLLALQLPPAPASYVTDHANLLDDGREHALNERLAQYERETSNQLLVYVDRRLPEGTTIEELGAEAIRTWKVGQEKKDNGAILFLLVDERQSRIEVGYGLEGVLTDARSKRILVDLRDDLRAGDYISAAERGAEKIIATIADPSDPPPAPAVQEAQAVDTSSMNGPPLPFYLALLGFLGVVLLVAYKVRQSEREGGEPHLSLNLSSHDDSSSSDWSSSSSSSFSSSSDSSSSFSGGGGSGGGGGASDRW